MIVNVDKIGAGKTTSYRVVIYGDGNGRVVWSGRRLLDAEVVASFLRTQHETVQRAAWERGA